MRTVYRPTVYTQLGAGDGPLGACYVRSPLIDRLPEVKRH
jgi:hypothetical protein